VPPGPRDADGVDDGGGQRAVERIARDQKAEVDRAEEQFDGERRREALAQQARPRRAPEHREEEVPPPSLEGMDGPRERGRPIELGDQGTDDGPERSRHEQVDRVAYQRDEVGADIAGVGRGRVRRVEGPRQRGDDHVLARGPAAIDRRAAYPGARGDGLCG